MEKFQSQANGPATACLVCCDSPKIQREQEFRSCRRTGGLAVEQWSNGAMEQWSNGAMEQWSNSERRHRKSSFLSGKKFPENGLTL
jgi:hypothetical protein